MPLWPGKQMLLQFTVYFIYNKGKLCGKVQVRYGKQNGDTLDEKM